MILTTLLKWMPANNFVVANVQTNRMHGEAVEIVLLNARGQTLLDRLVRPPLAIEPDTQAYHGITNEMVKTAPPFPLLFPKVRNILRGKVVLAYGAQYASAALERSRRFYNIEDGYDCQWVCVMHAFAEHYGDYPRGGGQPKFKRLDLATASFGITVPAERQGLNKALSAYLVARALERHYAE